MKPSFRTYHKKDKPHLHRLIQQLYAEDKGGQPMDSNKIERTIFQLTKFPPLGKIVIIEVARQVIGYCILLNYWSNEYGGNIMIIDEIFIEDEYRRQGIGTLFMERLKQGRFGGVEAICLQINTENENAQLFYKKMGFIEDGYKHLITKVKGK